MCIRVCVFVCVCVSCALLQNYHPLPHFVVVVIFVVAVVAVVVVVVFYYYYLLPSLFIYFGCCVHSFRKP